MNIWLHNLQYAKSYSEIFDFIRVELCCWPNTIWCRSLIERPYAYFRKKPFLDLSFSLCFPLQVISWRSCCESSHSLGQATFKKCFLHLWNRIKNRGIVSIFVHISGGFVFHEPSSWTKRSRVPTLIVTLLSTWFLNV